jgi:hypothetical protein
MFRESKGSKIWHKDNPYYTYKTGIQENVVQDLVFYAYISLDDAYKGKELKVNALIRPRLKGKYYAHIVGEMELKIQKMSKRAPCAEEEDPHSEER